MKIDFTQPLSGLDDEPIKDETSKDVLLSTPCINSLLATSQNEQTEPVEKLARWVLAQKITKATAPIDLTIEEVAKIKDLTGKYMPILIMGSVWQILEGNGKPKEE
jgi:hypothetical protein